MRTLLLDAGHGGADPGAVSIRGVREADINLDVVLRLGPYLEDQWRLILTRTRDVTVGLHARVRLAEEVEADAVVSIHCNAADGVEANGFEVWSSVGETRSDVLATRMWMHYRRAFPGLRGRVDYTDRDPDKERNFFILRKTSMPAVLFELAFLSNPSEEALLRSPRWRDRAAAALAAGINEWGQEEESV